MTSSGCAGDERLYAVLLAIRVPSISDRTRRAAGSPWAQTLPTCGPFQSL